MSEDAVRVTSILNAQLPSDVADDLGGHIRYVRDTGSPGLRLHNGTSWVSLLNNTLALTAGSVLFGKSDGSIGEDNANLFWNDTNKRLGIGTTSPARTLQVLDAIRITGASPTLDFGSTSIQAWIDGSSNLVLKNVSDAVRISTGQSVSFVSAGPHAIGGATVAGTALTLYSGAGTLHAFDLRYGAGETQGLRFTSGGILALGTTVVTSASVGEQILANAKALRGVNIAGTETISLIQAGGGSLDSVVVGNVTQPTVLGGGFTPTGAGGSELVLGNTKGIRGMNAAGTNTIRLIETDTSNNVLIDASGNSVVTGGSVKTAAPSGGTAAAWKFGVVSVVSPTAQNRTIELEVGGTTYYLTAKTTNN